MNTRHVLSFLLSACLAVPALAATYTYKQTTPGVVAGTPDVLPPTGPTDPSFASVSLLTHFEGNANDVKGLALSPAGTVTYSTTQKKVGSYAAQFDGSSYLSATIPASSTFGLANSDFTVEAWLYNAQPGARVYNTVVATSNWTLYITNGNQLRWTTQSVGTLVGPTIPQNTWSHIAVTRAGTTMTIYLNGAVAASGTVNNGATTGTSLAIGNDPSGLANRQFAGYIDDLRITKGVVRYSGTFTPSTTPFPDQ